MKSKWFLVANIVASVIVAVVLGSLSLFLFLDPILFLLIFLFSGVPILLIGWIGYHTESHSSAWVCAMLSFLMYVCLIHMPAFGVVLVALYVIAYMMQKKINDPYYIPKSERENNRDSCCTPKPVAKNLPAPWSDRFIIAVRICSIVATVASLLFFVYFSMEMLDFINDFKSEFRDLQSYQIFSGIGLSFGIIVLRTILFLGFVCEILLITFIWVGHHFRKRSFLWAATAIGLATIWLPLYTFAGLSVSLSMGTVLLLEKTINK